MTRPHRKGNNWCIKLDNGYKIEFVSYEEAWEYYEASDIGVVNLAL